MDPPHPRYPRQTFNPRQFYGPTPPTPKFRPTPPTPFFDLRQNFMDPRHPRQNFDPRHPHHFCDPRQNFTDSRHPRHPRHPRQNLTHATHEPTHPRYPCHPRTHANHDTHAILFMHKIKTNSSHRIFLHQFQTINHKYGIRYFRNNFKEPKREINYANIAFMRAVRLFGTAF